MAASGFPVYIVRLRNKYRATLRPQCYAGETEGRHAVKPSRCEKGHFKKCQILKCLILKNKDLLLMQNVPKNPMVSFVFSVRGLELPPNHV